LLTSGQVLAALPGLTARRLQWWDERDIIRHDHMDGHRRIYHRAQLAEFALLLELSKRGLSLQKTKRLLRLATGIIEIARGHGYIVTDGRKLKICDTPDDVIDEAVKFQCGVHVIDLAGLKARVKL
jgi:DNA-binding transcriptional MerR regulator